ncbi:putative endo-polygalacturonase [Helianthus debilis subsp. tardiflorus]
MVLFFGLCYISSSPQSASATIVDVTAYGAKGDGNTDDTIAFVRAWAGLCSDTSRKPTMVIPPRKLFLIRPVTFSGPCKSPAVYVKVKRVYN